MGDITLLQIECAIGEQLSTAEALFGALAERTRDVEGATRPAFSELGQCVGADPTTLAPEVREQLKHAASTLNIAFKEMATVGHDASVFARAGIPSAMGLVRNSHGSHNPDETLRIADYGAGIALLARTILGMFGTCVK